MRKALLLLGTSLLAAAELPQAEIQNSSLHMKLYLPDAANGFYRATRFDWSGMIYSLEYAGHRFYGPWFQRTDPKVHDFVYQGSEIVSGPCTAATGPAEEFTDLGYNDAKPGGTFIKIGVGVLRRPDDSPYDHFKLYDVVNSGKWKTNVKPTAIEFIQQLHDPASGYGYEYHKTIRLVGNAPEFIIEHTFRNTGKKPISSRVYNHNFLVIDGQAPGPDVRISVPFDITSPRPPDASMAEIHGKEIVYRKTLAGQDRVMTEMNGFGSAPSDYDVLIRNTRTGAGVRISSDRPLARLMLWSIRAVLAAEPFIEFAVQPGESYSWNLKYRYLKSGD